MRVNVYKNCKHGSHICKHGFIFWVPKRTVSSIRHFESDTFFVFQRYKLYSGIIYYDERSLLLSGSYNGLCTDFIFAFQI